MITFYTSITYSSKIIFDINSLTRGCLSLPSEHLRDEAGRLAYLLCATPAILQGVFEENL